MPGVMLGAAQAITGKLKTYGEVGRPRFSEAVFADELQRCGRGYGGRTEFNPRLARGPRCRRKLISENSALSGGASHGACRCWKPAPERN